MTPLPQHGHKSLQVWWGALDTTIHIQSMMLQSLAIVDINKACSKDMHCRTWLVIKREENIKCSYCRLRSVSQKAALLAGSMKPHM